MTHGLSALTLDPGLTALGAPYFSRVAPTPLPAPQLVAFNPDAAALIDLDPAEANRPEFAEIMAGNRPLPGGVQVATVYAGHQFGVFVPQLGDGRAILIGQVRGEPGGPRSAPAGARPSDAPTAPIARSTAARSEARNANNDLWELQLKGAGKTPYSRFGDGRAVLRSTIREYLCGEAMHGLGIPTTRALCIVGSPEPVQRETVETAAVLCRMAPSHLRFGHFEYFYYRGEHDKLAPLADHIIETYFPHLLEGHPSPYPLPQGEGKKQPSSPPLEGGGGGRGETYAAWLTEVVERTARLMAQWQAVGFCHGVMNTDNFSILGLTLDYGPYGFMEAFDAGWICNHSDEGGRYAYEQQPGVGFWNCSRLLQAALPLLHAEPEEGVKVAHAILDRYGPAYVAANLAHWRAKLGLREARDSDPELINSLLNILHRSKADFTHTFRALSNPAAARDHVLDQAAFDAWLKDYAARLDAEPSGAPERTARMNRVNPKYVLRNHLAQAAIEKAQAGDFGEIETLRRLLTRPFDEQPGMERYTEPGKQHIEVSCSS